MKALTLQKTTLYESLNEIRFLKGVKVCVPDHFCVLVMAGLHYNHTHRRLTVDEFLFKCKRKKKENKTKQKRETNYLLCNDVLSSPFVIIDNFTQSFYQVGP